MSNSKLIGIITANAAAGHKDPLRVRERAANTAQGAAF